MSARLSCLALVEALDSRLFLSPSEHCLRIESAFSHGVQVAIEVESRPAAVVIPVAAVVSTADGTFVDTVSGNGKVTRVKIVVFEPLNLGYIHQLARVGPNVEKFIAKATHQLPTTTAEGVQRAPSVLIPRQKRLGEQVAILETLGPPLEQWNE